MTPSTDLPTRELRELSVSALGLGCLGMSEFYGDADEAENIRTLDRALDLGVTFFDTADIYGPHTNEELLGRWLRGKRDAVVLATKFGIVREPGYPMQRSLSGRPEYVRKSIEASLRRLKTDHVDLYYLHRLDPETPVEDTVGAMGELVERGMVRYLGLSEVDAGTLRRADATYPITALQSEYSLWTRDPEHAQSPGDEQGPGDEQPGESVLAACRDLGVGLVPYSPLGRGFLTGQLKSPDDFGPDDFRRHSPRFQGENFQKNLDLVAEVQQMARDKSCTGAQLALAWVLAQGKNIVPIPGTKRVKYLEENLGALEVTLTADDLARIDATFPPGVATGARYGQIQAAQR